MLLGHTISASSFVVAEQTQMHQYAMSSVSNLFLQALQATTSSNPPQRLSMTERQLGIHIALVSL